MADPTRALIIGYFSTAGDIESLQVVQSWLTEARIAFDVAPYGEKIRAVLSGSLDLQKIKPEAYRYLIVVCGPCSPETFTSRKIDLQRFEHCIRIGVNLTMIQSVAKWNPFDVLLERDSDRAQRPDLTFVGKQRLVPVAGRCFIQQQLEYGSRQRHDLAHQLLNELIVKRRLGCIDIDTRFLGDSGIQRTPEHIVSVMGRVDVLLTTRLHGLVYALKAGRPVIAIDPILGGDKIIAQARCIGWPKVCLAEKATPQWLNEALDWCLSDESRHSIQQCKERVSPLLAQTRDEFFSALAFKKSGQPTVR